MTQLTRCKCGHVLLLHAAKCKHPNCKCKAFKQEGTATLADTLKPDSINILLALKHKLATKPTIINIYGNFRTFTAVGQRRD
jgi:hypothetical protein